jgi:RNA polymerase sigma factor (sigma-70 family)
VTQEALATVAKAIDRFDPDSERGSFRGWLFRISRNLIINFLTRSNEPRGTGDTEMQLFLQQTPVADEATATLFEVEREREIFRWAAKRVRGRFLEVTWQAFWLTAVEGKSTQTVAAHLVKSTGSVRVSRCRVLAHLQQEVKRFEEHLFDP